MASSIFIELDITKKDNFERQVAAQISEEQLPRQSVNDIIKNKNVGTYYFNTEQKIEEERGDRPRTTEGGKQEMNIILEFKITQVEIKQK